MLAYACDPEGSGEHWLGWGWAEQAGQFCDVHLFTTPKARPAIERHAAALGITPHFIALPAFVRGLSKRLGPVGRWWRKISWQRRAARAVAALHRRSPISLVHQTTFHTFRVPFAAASLGIPAVWGPIAGGEEIPPGFERCVGRAQNAERWRRLANRLCLAAPSVRRSLREAGAIFVSNRTTLQFLPPAARAKCEIVPPNALRAGDAPQPGAARDAHPGLRLLYVGNCVATRSLPLVLQALERLREPSLTLTVAGQGSALAGWREEAGARGLASQVTFVGQVPRAALDALYAAADVLVFPALRDAGGSALLEAMSRGLPVVCFDWGGPAEMVTEDSGVKIPVQDPAQTVAALEAAFTRLRAEPAWRASLAARAAARIAEEFTWEAKRRVLEATYTRLLRAA